MRESCGKDEFQGIQSRARGLDIMALHLAVDRRNERARGLSKAKAEVDVWMREIAPSTDLRRWYGHDAEKWPEFRKRYHAELDEIPDIAGELVSHAKKEQVTLLFGSREQRLNNAFALKQYLESRARRR